ncbi:hypothetical protein [Staphylococcus epidermidis]|uniref:hypothetical protein n=1 Tax=Staphylococcus epidermidis TaxID=1282 RepID=UPI00294AB4E6|nr:hypothetical protein [Staphylococcus epidermidis]
MTKFDSKAAAETFKVLEEIQSQLDVFKDVGYSNGLAINEKGSEHEEIRRMILTTTNQINSTIRYDDYSNDDIKKIVDYACDLLSKIGDYVGKELSSK